MIRRRAGGCRVDLLDVVNGLPSEAQKVRDAYGGYESYGLCMGIEAVQAIKSRMQLDSDFEVSELDIAYASRMMEITDEEVVMPSPAMCVLVDLVAKDGGNVIPLDMNDEEFTELYCDVVPATQFTREHRVARKGMKKNFRAKDPQSFALEWDAYVNGGISSYAEVSRRRERYIADQIRKVAEYRSSLLVLVEVERASGIAALLEDP